MISDIKSIPVDKLLTNPVACTRLTNIFNFEHPTFISKNYFIFKLINQSIYILYLYIFYIEKKKRIYLLIPLNLFSKRLVKRIKLLSIKIQ